MKISKIIESFLLNLGKTYENIGEVTFKIYSSDSLRSLGENELDLLDASVSSFVGRSSKKKSKKVEIKTMKTQSGALLYLVVSGKSSKFMIKRILLMLANAGTIEKENINYSLEELEQDFGILRKKETSPKMTKV